MADIDSNKDNPESSASSPNSTGDQNGSKASKDRSCPFCGQAFTSSSLGRHLDLYIKPKNPKPPDGVHDVNEIRKIRGGITRRQPRTSLKASFSVHKEHAPRRDSSGWSSNPAKNTSKDNSRITDRSPLESPVNAKDDHLHTWFNTPTWHATGVINDLPAREPSRNQNATASTGQAERLKEMRRDTSGNRVERPEYGTDDIWKLQESAEVGRAAEMALREVLGSLEAAKKKVEPTALFEEFEFCSLSFPGLCLAILPPPSSLFSSTPFPAAHTWPLTPPGENQFNTLNRVINERVASIRKGRISNLPDSVVFRYHVHLQGSYEHWQLMSETDKAQAWNLEISRAFVREQKKRQQLRNDHETSQQRVRQLEAEYDRLSRCQLPREFLLHPPNTVPVSSAVMREMGSTDVTSGAAEVNFDPEALINKWRATVKATKRPHKPAPTENHHYVETRRNPLRGDMMMNGAVWGINGPMPRDNDRHEDPEDQVGVMYETPSNPGGIVDAEDDGPMEVDADADGEAEEDVGSFGDYRYSGALTKLRSSNRTPYDAPVNGLLNANGKRSLDPGGRNSGPKLHKEQPKG